MNDDTSTYAYIIAFNDCYDLWHSRLGHINTSYVKNMQNLGLILGINFKDKNAKCQMYVETKLAKKSYKSINRESKLLELINTTTGSSKKYYLIFIDDFSKYTKVHFFRHKHEALDMFFCL